ncbi:protein of unknown function (plasmid) [Caballeronia sp. S22]
MAADSGISGYLVSKFEIFAPKSEVGLRGLDITLRLVDVNEFAGPARPKLWATRRGTST